MRLEMEMLDIGLYKLGIFLIEHVCLDGHSEYQVKIEDEDIGTEVLAGFDQMDGAVEFVFKTMKDSGK